MIWPDAGAGSGEEVGCDCYVPGAAVVVTAGDGIE